MIAGAPRRRGGTGRSRADGDSEIVDAAGVFHVLGDPTRLAILAELRQADGICACDFHCCGLTQPTMSHHLKMLRDSGLVRTEKCGLWVRYSLNPDLLAQLQHFLAERLLVAEDVEAREDARLPTRVRRPGRV